MPLHLLMGRLHLFVFLGFCVVSCKHEVASPELYPISTSELCDSDTVYFAQDILPMLEAACGQSGCHDQASHEDDIIIDSYANIVHGEENDLVIPGSPNGSELMEVINDNDPDDVMPPPPASPLSHDQIDLIALWIEQGALNNSCLSCDSTSFEFATVIQPLIQNMCVSCHSGLEPDGELDLSSHSNITGAVTYRDLMNHVSQAPGFDPMPPNGSGLSACQLFQLQEWINEGMPNN